MGDYIVEMRHITKRFPGIIANDDVSIGIRKGKFMHSWVRTARENQR